MIHKGRLMTFTEAVNKKTDYKKKFGKKIKEVNKYIKQANKDDIWAIEVDSTWESVYEFDNVWIEKDKLKCKYTEIYNKNKEKVEEINLKQDEMNDFEETKYLLSWIKKCIKKGYKEEGKKAPF